MDGTSSKDFRFGTIILAAGRSRRMGQPKLLLAWRGTSVLGHLLNRWQELGSAQTGAVLARGDLAMERELDRLGFPRDSRIFNEDPERGMFSSIQTAARWPHWNPSLTHWAVVLGDQPHLRHDTLASLLEFAREHSASVCQPSHRGKPKHPVLLPKPAFSELSTIAAGDLKQFLQGHEVALRELEDPGLELDIDRPEDYQAALKLAND